VKAVEQAIGLVPKEKATIIAKAVLFVTTEFMLNTKDILMIVARKNGDKGDYLVKIYTKHQPILIEIWFKEGKIIDSYVYDKF